MVKTLDKLRELDTQIEDASKDALAHKKMLAEANKRIRYAEEERKECERKIVRDMAVHIGDGFQLDGAGCAIYSPKTKLLLDMIDADDDTFARFKMFWSGE